MDLKEIQARMEEISKLTQAVSKLAEAENRALTEEDQAEILALNTEFDDLTVKRDEIKAEAKAQAERKAKIDEILAKMVEAGNTDPSSGVQPLNEDTPVKVPAQALRHKSDVFASDEDAYLCGRFMAAMVGHKESQEFMAAQEIGDDTKGGYTVPSPLAAELINLIKDYGIVRNVCRNIAMTADTWRVPKQNSHTTIYYVNEAESITESELTMEQTTMVAQKMAGLVKLSTEVTEDSLINMIDTVIRDLAWGFAKAEDENLFTGGSLYTGGIQGDASVSDANVASVAALDLTDFTDCTVRSGQQRGLRPEWYINPTLYHGKVRDLLNAAGGNTMDILQGGQKPTLLGYPVNFTHTLPGAGASTSGDCLAVFGDLGVSHYWGSRRALEFRVLNELFAVTDQVGVICTQRVALEAVNPEVLAKITLT